MFRKVCPGGLLFNPQGYCDWPANVNCDTDSNSPATTTTTTTITPVTTTTTTTTTTASSGATGAFSCPGLVFQCSTK